MTITPHFSSPIRVVEGQPLTLNWTYSIEGSTFRRLTFGITAVPIVDVPSSGDSFILDDRVSVHITGTNVTNVTITFRTVDRDDSDDYTLVVLTFGSESGTSVVTIIVECK